MASTGTTTKPSAAVRGVDVLAWSAVVLAVGACVGCLAVAAGGGAVVDVPWAPALGARLSFGLDGLGLLYGLLATGIGAVVFVYAAAYMPRHLAHDGRQWSERWRFWPWMALFLLSMVGLALAQDLVLLFVLFDLTAVCSYFLIGFDRHRKEARRAALMAMLVTGISAIPLLIAALLLQSAYGTFSIPALAEQIAPGATTTLAAALLAVAALAKSAQVPLHFWLPKAMAAPTPVSAYLHSAAMVAAGVLVIGRVYPLLAGSALVLGALQAAGLASIVVGGALALVQDELKQVLAYSTVSQYGYVVLLYGLGGEAGVAAASFYVIAHALAKSALFLTAGAVTEATGESRLGALGGLRHDLPALAVASGVAAATLAALPLTVGFFKDELFFTAALEAGPPVAALAVVAAALTFAYIARFWARLFLGERRTQAEPIPRLLVAPVVALALVGLVGGVIVEPFARLAGGAATVSHGAGVALQPAYHLDARPENVMALAAWGLGGLILATSRAFGPAARRMLGAVARVGPTRVYEGTLAWLGKISDSIHRAEVRDLRNSLATVLVPGGILTALAFAITPTRGAYDVGRIQGDDLLLIALLVLIAAASFSVARTGEHLRAVLALSVVGFALASVYALIGAPDVALVAVVVETIIALMFLGVLARLPRSERPLAARGEGAHSRRWRDPVVGVLAGAAAFTVIWGFLSPPVLAPGIAAELIRLSPAAHGKSVVTVILADFRGLDTLGEITVLVIAMVGMATLLRRGRLWGPS